MTEQTDIPARIPLIGPLSKLGLGMCVITFVADQAHKTWFLWAYKLAEGQRVRIAPFLDYAYVKNRGISYGLFSQGSMTGQYVLALFAIVATVALGLWLARLIENRILAVSLGLIMGGALGNALDRVLHGGVVDYFSLHAFGYYWYVFNIADVAIVAGVVGLLYDSFWPSRAETP
jgi:signal peptidase II